MPRGERTQGAPLTRAEGTEVTERTGSPQRNGATEVERRRCAGSTGRPATQADWRDQIGSRETNTSEFVGWCSFPRSDPIRAASLRDARRTRASSVRSPLLRCSVVLPFSPSPPLSDGYTAGEIDVILKSSIFIAGTSAVPGIVVGLADVHRHGAAEHRDVVEAARRDRRSSGSSAPARRSRRSRSGTSRRASCRC